MRLLNSQADFAGIVLYGEAVPFKVTMILERKTKRCSPNVAAKGGHGG